MRLPTPIRSRLSEIRNRWVPDHWVRVQSQLKEIDCSPWRRLVIFDVGANDGTTFAELQRRLPWTKIYAFEPTPELVERIRASTRGARNFHLVPKAVGETPGWATFNVAGQGDWGCSSLLEFSDGLDRTWPGRTDFVVTRQIKVEIIRLDTFILESNIAQIDFLHIDTQGTDVSVLRSLGSELKRVRAGVIEVPQSKDVMLYRNQHTREEALEFLAVHGFAVWKTIPQQNEDNLYFRRTRKALSR